MLMIKVSVATIHSLKNISVKWVVFSAELLLQWKDCEVQCLCMQSLRVPPYCRLSPQLCIVLFLFRKHFLMQMLQAFLGYLALCEKSPLLTSYSEASVV